MLTCSHLLPVERIVLDPKRVDEGHRVGPQLPQQLPLTGPQVGCLLTGEEPVLEQVGQVGGLDLQGGVGCMCERCGARDDESPVHGQG